ncbi:hypothetical protein FRC17_006003 [Serendipita sp. 399]|nr:hypothetical protein FRC17_006003 [Serendipita sp. 399]
MGRQPGRQQVGRFTLRLEPTSQRQESSQVTPPLFAPFATTPTGIEESSRTAQTLQNTAFIFYLPTARADDAHQPANVTDVDPATNGCPERKTTPSNTVDDLKASLSSLSFGNTTATATIGDYTTQKLTRTAIQRLARGRIGVHPEVMDHSVGDDPMDGLQRSPTANGTTIPIQPAPPAGMATNGQGTNGSRRQSVGRKAKREDSGVYAPSQSGRKNRTVFSEEQHNALLAAYEADKYPTTIQKELLARQLGIAPIVVINWFQHRRQREPVKEKGGYVRNHPRADDTAKFLASIGIIIPARDRYGRAIPGSSLYGDFTGTSRSSTTNGIQEYNGDRSWPLPPELDPARRDSTDSIGEPSSVSPPPSDMQVASEGSTSNLDQVPKTANAHIGPLRWDLDPLYIAPYVDHAFTGAYTFPGERFTLKPCPHMPENDESESS